MTQKLFSPNLLLNCNGKLLDLTAPRVMGILNITPDSFYANSRLHAEEQVLQCAEKMLTEGASILDIGGYSTRPFGAKHIDDTEEADRVLPAIECIKKHFPDTIISIDTFRANVAQQAVNAGASIVNDVSGGNIDDAMFQTVANLNVPYILTHMRGTPQTMGQFAHYQDITLEVIDELQKKVYALRQLLVKDIIIDPGFGFAKNLSHNFELMAKLSVFAMFEMPILVGISRKTIVWKHLNITPQEALNGTTALNMVALQNGANLLRVHDVKEAMETIALWKEIKRYLPIN